MPTVLCSPYIPAIKTGTSGPVYDHTSILSTVRSAFGIQGGPLSAREAAATGLGGFLTLPPARLNLEPESVSAAVPGTSAVTDEPLNPLQRVQVKYASIVPKAEGIAHRTASLLAYRLDRSTNKVPDRETGIKIVREAAAQLFPPPRTS